MLPPENRQKQRFAFPAHVYRSANLIHVDARAYAVVCNVEMQRGAGRRGSFKHVARRIKPNNSQYKSHSRFFFLYSVNPAAVTFANSRNNFGSAPVKLKHDFPCIFFFKSGDNFFTSDASQYKGIR
jgi:hypothetical protein